MNNNNQKIPTFGDNNRLVYWYMPPVVGKAEPNIAIGNIVSNVIRDDNIKAGVIPLPVI